MTKDEATAKVREAVGHMGWDSLVPALVALEVIELEEPMAAEETAIHAAMEAAVEYSLPRMKARVAIEGLRVLGRTLPI